MNRSTDDTRVQIGSLFHITHYKNLPRILDYGIQSYNESLKQGYRQVDISDPKVQERRNVIDPVFNRSLHDYAPTYINPRNPMLYVRRNVCECLAILEISTEVLTHFEFLICDGNAASKATAFYSTINDCHRLPWAVLNGRYWTEFPDGRRKMCSECLIYPWIPRRFIARLHFRSEKYRKSYQRFDLSVSCSPQLFF